MLNKWVSFSSFSAASLKVGRPFSVQQSSPISKVDCQLLDLEVSRSYCEFRQSDIMALGLAGFSSFLLGKWQLWWWLLSFSVVGWVLGLSLISFWEERPLIFNLVAWFLWLLIFANRTICSQMFGFKFLAILFQFSSDLNSIYEVQYYINKVHIYKKLYSKDPIIVNDISLKPWILIIIISIFKNLICGCSWVCKNFWRVKVNLLI